MENPRFCPGLSPQCIYSLYTQICKEVRDLLIIFFWYNFCDGLENCTIKLPNPFFEGENFMLFRYHPRGGLVLDFWH
jgi:hypothetical protein